MLELALQMEDWMIEHNTEISDLATLTSLKSYQVESVLTCDVDFYLKYGNTSAKPSSSPIICLLKNKADAAS